MFSSIEIGERRNVIKKCYWPLINLAEKGFKLGIELTGNTLEIIKSLDPLWIEKFKSLLLEEKLELIGSGYAQIIGPLVPAEVNDWNQKLGLEIYQEILGVIPEIALVNEMAYSSGIIEHYINNGYKAIIMEWNNPRKYHPEWDNQYRYYAQKAINHHAVEINLIWADSIAFQKFQRYAYGENSLKDQMNYLLDHQNKESRFFPLYTSDAEVFDYRPGRFNSEAVQSQDFLEWDRIELLLDEIKSNPNMEIILPSSVLKEKGSFFSAQQLSLESTEQPIPVKKQGKYNINRWALTGKNDLELNTTCYKVFTKIQKSNNKKYWKELCFFWSSDFRTHITKGRWENLQKAIIKFKNELPSNKEIKKRDDEFELFKIEDSLSLVEDQKYKKITNSKIEVILNISKGCVIQSFRKLDNKIPLFGTIDHGYFEDIEFGVDFYSGHTVIEQLGKHKITDLATRNIRINKKKGNISILTNTKVDDTEFEKLITLKKDSLKISSRIKLNTRIKQIIHPYHFTFFSEVWDNDSLYFATHNGGNNIETFPINSKDFNHGDNHSFLISAKHGLGNTKGIVIIGDKEKKLVFTINLEQSFLIPSVLYKKVEGDKFLLRLIYSAQEIDETFFPSPVPNTLSVEINIHCERVVK